MRKCLVIYDNYLNVILTTVMIKMIRIAVVTIYLISLLCQGLHTH